MQAADVQRQIEGPTKKTEPGHIAHKERARNTSAPCALAPLRDGARREVHADRIPAVLGEIHDVRPRPAPEIERSARRADGDETHQLGRRDPGVPATPSRDPVPSTR